MKNNNNIFIKIRNSINEFKKYINSNKNISSFVEKTSYFLYNFRHTIFLIIGIILFICIKSSYKYNFETDNITNNIDNSKFVGNAVAVNGFSFVTNYKSIQDTCKITKPNQKLRLFLISNNNRFEVSITNYDEFMDIAILTMLHRYRQNTRIKNFVLFPNMKTFKTKSGDYVYLSKTINDLKYKYKKVKLKEDKQSYIQYVNVDKIRKNTGELVLNDKLEFVGITADMKGSKISPVKKMEVVTQDKIRNFLRGNGVYYFTNMRNDDLSVVVNYIYDINYKLVCSVETPPVPRTFKIYK